MSNFVKHTFIQSPTLYNFTHQEQHYAKYQAEENTMDLLREVFHGVYLDLLGAPNLTMQ